MNLDYIISKARNKELLDRDEIINLLSLNPDSPDSYRVMAEATRISKSITGGKAEVHAQLALNLAPCPCNCMFCSFAQKNGLFTQESRLSTEQAVSYAKQFEEDGANAIFIMTTAQYPLSLFVEVSQEIRNSLKPETIMVANVGDQSLEGATRIRDIGYSGVYHALRLREGTDSSLKPEKRKESIKNFLEAGLKVGTCVEPVGPEHSNEEIADLILFTASFDAAFSGAARRIPIPGTEMEKLGKISELRMAQIVAVTRLALPLTTLGNCTHEPCTLGAVGGANLFWAEVGANPRDIKEKTEEGRGETVESCRLKFQESGWAFLEGPSQYYGKMRE